MSGLLRHDGNGMVETAYSQDKRERGWGGREDEEESELFQFALELSRSEWERIKAEKGD